MAEVTKITIEHYDETYSAEISAYANADRVMRVVVSLLVSAGYSERDLAQMFVNGNPRDWDSAWGKD